MQRERDTEETGGVACRESGFRGIIFSRPRTKATRRNGVSLFRQYTRYKRRAGRMRLFISVTENRYPPISLAPAANISFGFAYQRENRVIPQIASGRGERHRVVSFCDVYGLRVPLGTESRRWSDGVRKGSAGN